MKTAISPASAKLLSIVRCKAISPKREDVPTVGFVLTRDEAVDLAAKILEVAQAINAAGDIHVTGRQDNTITIIRKIKGTKATKIKR